MTNLFELLPWLLTAIVAIRSIFKQDATPFLNLWWFYVISGFAYLAYLSLFQNAHFGSFYNIFPLHLSLLLLLMTVFIIKRLLTYKDMADAINGEQWYILSIIAVVGGVSFFIGSLFLGYGKEQYFVSAINLIIAVSIYLANKRFPLWTLQVTSIAILIITMACYVSLNGGLTGNIEIKNVVESARYFVTPMAGCVFFFVGILAATKLVSEKTWGHLVTIWTSLLSIGFIAHHPELTELVKPSVKEVMELAAVYGYGGVSLFSLAALLKVKTGIA